MQRENPFRELKIVCSEWNVDFEARGKSQRWAWRNKQGQVTRNPIQLEQRVGRQRIGSERWGASTESNPLLFLCPSDWESVGNAGEISWPNR